MRGFRFFFSHGFAVCAFGQRPKTCRPAADEAPRRSRKKLLVPRLVSQIKSIEKSVKEVTYVCPQEHMQGTCCQYFYHCKEITMAIEILWV